MYNVLLFSVDNLTHASRHLVFENGYIGGPTSLLLFDYLVYTTYVIGLTRLLPIPTILSDTMTKVQLPP